MPKHPQKNFLKHRYFMDRHSCELFFYTVWFYAILIRKNMRCGFFPFYGLLSASMKYLMPIYLPAKKMLSRVGGKLGGREKLKGKTTDFQA